MVDNSADTKWPTLHSSAQHPASRYQEPEHINSK